MLIITTLEALSNVKSVLDLVTTISRYIKRKSTIEDRDEMQRGVLSYAEKQGALEATLREWEHIAVVVEPALRRELGQHTRGTLSDRAEALAKLARDFASLEIDSSHAELNNIFLRHTAFVALSDGRLQLCLGQSEQTQYLRGETIDIYSDKRLSMNYQLPNEQTSNGGKMVLPTFKVTMLGDSGVGKTVFMSSMYAKLRDGSRGVAIRAINNDVDLELEQNMTDVYTFNNWPPGTDVNEKRYEFELLLRKRPIARVDWVDYRGGALVESETKEGGSTLIKRLQESNSIIWMIDMSRLNNGVINSMSARLKTKVGRMAHLCRQALAVNNNSLRSILFVRTKADEVLNNNGEPDWGQACEQLISHLGPENFGDIPCAAAIPISSVGRVTGDKQVMGDDPYNVEWPLLLSLAFMLKIDLGRLDQSADNAFRLMTEARPGKLIEFFKDTFGMGLNEEQLRAMRDLETVSRQLIGMREVIGELLKHRPSSIKMFQKE